MGSFPLQAILITGPYWWIQVDFGLITGILAVIVPGSPADSWCFHSE